MATAELCRCHGITPVTFCNLKLKYGGMDESNAMLGIAALKDIWSKNDYARCQAGSRRSCL
jgi:hypothetical protein